MTTLLTLGLQFVWGCGGSTESDEEPTPSATDDPAEVEEPAEPCASATAIEGSVCIQRISGQFLSASGDPPPAESLVTVCGPTCYPGATDAEGNFSVTIDQYLVLSEYSALLHGRPTYSGDYLPLPEDAEGPELDLGEITVFELPESGPAIPDEALEEAELESEGVRLTIPAGSETVFDLTALGEGEEAKVFRALPLVIDDPVRKEGDVEGAFAYYALDPFETFFVTGADRVRAKVPLSFPNSAELEADALVEVLALGSYLYTDFVTPARFEVVAQARVSADGQRIETEPGEGLEVITWVALRPSSE